MGLRRLKPPYLAWLISIAYCTLFVVYSASLALNYADSDDLTLASWSGGVAHPPGFFTYTRIVGSAMRLLPTVSPARIAHAVSAVTAGVSMGLLYLCLRHWLIEKRVKHTDLASVSAVIIYGSQMQVLTHATVAEVFPLVTLILLVWIRTLQRGVKGKNILWSALLAAAACTLHPLSGLAVAIIGLSYLLGKKIARPWTYIAVFIMVCILFLGSYITINPRNKAYSWEVDHSVAGLTRLFLRQDYAVNGSQIETYAGTFDLEHSLWSLGQFFSIVYKELGVAGALALILGLAYMLKRPKKYTAILLLLACSGPAIMLYLKLPQPVVEADETFYIGTALRLRQLYIFQTGITAPIALGIAHVYTSISNYSYRSSKILSYLLLLYLTTFGLYRLMSTSPEHDNATAVLSKEILMSLPPASTLIVDHDMIFAFYYTQLVDSIRPDIQIVAARIPLVINETVAPMTYYDQSYEQDIEIARYVAQTVLLGKRIFLYMPSQHVLSMIGVEGDPYFAVPYGYTIEVRAIPQPGPATHDYGVSASLLTLDQDNGWWTKGYLSHLSTLHGQLMYYLARAGYIDAATQHHALAQKLAQSQGQINTLDTILESAQKALESEGSYYQYVPYHASEYRTKAAAARTMGDADGAIYWQSRALMLEPKSASDAAIVLSDTSKQH